MNMNYEIEVATLEQQQTELSEQIKFSKTMEQRQRVLSLQQEMKAERARTAELKLKSAETDVFVSERVKELETEIRELKAKAFNDFHAMLTSDDRFKALNREVNALEKGIKAIL
jgi:Fe2+ transport system protein B